MNTHNFKSFRRNNSRIVKENGIVAQLAELTRVQKKRKNVVWSRIRVKFRSVTYRMRHSRVLNLLHLACEDVERHYGTSLAMYFYLIRILVWLDLILFIIALALIIIPWSLYYRANPSLTSLPNFQGTILSLVGVLPENIVTQEQPNILSQLPLYYGSYSAVMRGNTMGPTWTGTIILIYLVSLIIFLYHISRSVLKSLHSSETIKCLQAYAAAISWDWNVQDARVARSRKVATLIEVKGHINDLRQDIYDKMEESSSEFWNGARKARLRSFIGILLSILLLAGSLTALYFTIVNQGKLRAIFPYLHTIIISFINGAIPFFQRLVVAFQQLKSPQKILNRELLGTYLIKMMNIVFLVFQTNESRSSTGCVELDLGTTYVQLVLISAGASIVTSIAYLLLYYLLGYHTRQTPSADIIDTFYLQCMLFVLQSYNPFAFLYGLVLLLAVFTVKYAVIFRATQPPIDLTLVESNATMMLLLSGVLVFAAVPTFFFLNKEDITCGPFIGISPLNSFSDYLATSRFIRDVSRWLFNPLILVTVVILLLVLAIVMFAIARRNAIQSDITSANLQDEIRELKNRIGRSVALLEREKERNNALITTPIDANFLPGPKKADILEVEEYAPAFVTLRELTSAKGRDVEAISKKKSVRFEGIQSVASFGTEPTSPHFENKGEKVSYMLQAPIFTFEDIIPYLSASRLKPFNFKL